MTSETRRRDLTGRNFKVLIEVDAAGAAEYLESVSFVEKLADRIKDGIASTTQELWSEYPEAGIKVEFK